MIRWTPTTSLPPPQRWQSRAEILKAHLDSLGPLELLRVRPDYYAMTYGWDFVNRGYAQGRLARYVELDETAGFRQDQPRWPKGSGDDSGRWSGGAGTAPPQTGAAPPRGGHHFVPRAVFGKQPLRPETQKVFEQGVTGPLKTGPHQNSHEHFIYNEAAAEHYNRFLRGNGIRSEDMTPDQARKFLEEVKRSGDPRIRNFNLNIFKREFLYLLRRFPRRSE